MANWKRRTAVTAAVLVIAAGCTVDKKYQNVPGDPCKTVGETTDSQVGTLVCKDGQGMTHKERRWVKE